MYKFLLFDADETLFDFKRAERSAFSDVAAKYSLPMSDALYADYHVINDALWKDFERAEITKPALLVERFHKLAQKYGFDYDAAEVNRFYLASLGSYPYLLNGSVELCRTLSRTHSLYLITNGEISVQKNRYGASELRDYFLDVFISEQVGAAKPSLEYFDYVAAHIEGFDSRRALVIGDSLTSDIKGANNAGLDCVWFNPAHNVNDKSASVTYEIDALEKLYNIV